MLIVLTLFTMEGAAVSGRTVNGLTALQMFRLIRLGFDFIISYETPVVKNEILRN